MAGEHCLPSNAFFSGTPDYTLLVSISVGLNIKFANFSGFCFAFSLFDLFVMLIYFIHCV